METLLAACVALSFLLAAFLILFLSDRFWDTPSWVRVGLFSATVLSSLALLAWWFNHWVFNKRDLRDLANLVQKKYRRLGDRLLGIVELADEAKRPPNFSPELYQAAIQQVAEQSTEYNFSDAVSSAKTRRYAFIALALLALTLIPMLLIPDAGWNTFKRLLLPTAMVPRWTLVQLDGLPRELVVAHGEPFAVSGEVKYRSFWRPLRLKARYAEQAPLRAQSQGSRFQLQVPSQVQKGKLRLKIGDAFHEIAVFPEHRPALTAAAALVHLPEYLQYPPQQENAQSGALTVVEGSQIQLEAKVSRHLVQASLHREGVEALSLTVSSNRFSTPLIPAEDMLALNFSWVDSLGLTNRQLWPLRVHTQVDAAPAPSFPDLFRDTSILETEVLPIKVRAQDDFGLKSIGLAWEKQEEGEGAHSPVLTEFKLDLTNATTQVYEHSFSFSPAVLGIPSDTTIEIRSFAVDYLPGRTRAEGPAYRIHILGVAQHAEMIRQNLESLLVHLEEITRMEERLASETQEMKDFAKLDSPEATKKIEQLQQAQENTAKALKELAEEGMKSLREALRNPAFSEELLTKWTKDLHEMQQLSQQEMKQASQDLQNAAKNQPNPSQREQSLADAAQKQDEILQKLEQMQQKVNQGLDELQALTLAQRLRKLAGEEKRIEEKIHGAISDTIGLLPRELPTRYAKVNDLLSAQQNETHAQTVKIQGEISRFYERTQKQNYGEVSREMAETRTADELERIRQLIQDNIGMEAMQTLADWAGRFVAWADKLEPAEEENSSSGEGSGSGEGQQENSALKQLLALLRLREKQVNIQGRTRLLDQHVNNSESWRDGAVLLAASQAKLNRDVTRQAIENPYAILEAPFEDAITAGTDVESLLDRPRTDQVTILAQDKSVAVLSDLINLLNEQAKKNSPGQSGQSEANEPGQMDFLMQMMGQQTSMGMQQSPSPGGSSAGGTTNRTGESPTGDDAARTGDHRNVGRSSGVPSNYPVEFREALENYFKALEAEQK